MAALAATKVHKPIKGPALSQNQFQSETVLSIILSHGHKPSQKTAFLRPRMSKTHNANYLLTY